jgi:hypothetical protein
LSKEEKSKPSFLEILKANMAILIMVLSFPVMGMIAALGLIIYLDPPNITLLIGLVSFLIAQYVFLIYYLRKTIYKLAEDQKE